MRRTAIACEVWMGWKRIVFGAWLIASLAWANYAILQEFLHPTPWENAFFDPWFWIVSVGLPATALALLLQGVTWVVTRIQHGKKRKRRRRHSRSRRHGHRHEPSRRERHEPKLDERPLELTPQSRRQDSARPKIAPRAPR
jgi:hypothetical protein